MPVVVLGPQCAETERAEQVARQHGCLIGHAVKNLRRVTSATEMAHGVAYPLPITQATRLMEPSPMITVGCRIHYVGRPWPEVSEVIHLPLGPAVHLRLAAVLKRIG